MRNISFIFILHANSLSASNLNVHTNVFFKAWNKIIAHYNLDNSYE